MSAAAEEYEALAKRYRELLDAGSLADSDEDAMLDKMDDLWWRMSEEERAKVGSPPR